MIGLGVACLVGLFSGTADASATFREAGTFGLGLTSSPGHYGVSSKLFFGDTQAVQGTAAVDLLPLFDDVFRSFGVGVDYLNYRPLIREAQYYDVGVYLGAGLRVNRLGISLNDFDADAYAFTPSAIAGLEVGLVSAPVDFVIEYRPELTVVADGGGVFDLVTTSLMVRYYFL